MNTEKLDFELSTLQKLEQQDLKTLLEFLDIAKDKALPQIKAKVSKNPSMFKSIEYFNKYVKKTAKEIYYYDDGQLEEINKESFKDTYLNKLDVIINHYYDHVLNMIYTHTINPFKSKFFSENGKYYLNDMEPYRFKFIENYEKTEEEKQFVDFYKELILNVICSDNTDYFTHIWKCFCAIVQGHKLQAIIYLLGKGGCGKSYIVSIISYLLGSRFHPLALSELGQFNGNVYGKSLLNLDETKEAGKFRSELEKEAYKNMKRIATSQFLTLERKGKDQQVKKIECNLIITSNFIDPEEIAERRFNLFQCRFSKTQEYWDTCRDYVINPDKHEKLYFALFCEMMAENVTEFIHNAQADYKKLNIDIKRSISSDTVPNGVFFLKSLALGCKDLEGSRMKLIEACNEHLKSNDKIPIKKQTFTEQLENVGIYAVLNQHNKQFMYSIKNAELIKKLKDNNFLTDEEIYYNQEKKGEKYDIIEDELKESNEALPDGRDETIIRLKEENEKQKAEIEELKKETEKLKAVKQKVVRVTTLKDEEYHSLRRAFDLE